MSTAEAATTISCNGVEQAVHHQHDALVPEGAVGRTAFELEARVGLDCLQAKFESYRSTVTKRTRRSELASSPVSEDV